MPEINGTGRREAHQQNCRKMSGIGEAGCVVQAGRKITYAEGVTAPRRVKQK